MARTGGCLTLALLCVRCSSRRSVMTRPLTVASKCTPTFDPIRSDIAALRPNEHFITKLSVQTEVVREEHTRRCSWCLGVCTFTLIEKNYMSRDRYSCSEPPPTYDLTRIYCERRSFRFRRLHQRRCHLPHHRLSTYGARCRPLQVPRWTARESRSHCPVVSSADSPAPHRAVLAATLSASTA